MENRDDLFNELLADAVKEEENFTEKPVKTAEAPAKTAVVFNPIPSAPAAASAVSETVPAEEQGAAASAVSETISAEEQGAAASAVSEAVPAGRGGDVEVEREDNGFEDGEKPLDKNVRLMSPGRMVARRFFRSKLSIIGLVMILSLILFSWLGPPIMSAIPRGNGGGWTETTTDYDAPPGFGEDNPLITVDDDGKTYSFYQVVEYQPLINKRTRPSAAHWLGTDETGMDVFVRLMYGGQKSLAISFIAVFAITIIGIIFGGFAGYFGGKVDNVIMRICDILMCLPGLPILLILGSLLDAMKVPVNNRIYFLMLFLTIFSWSGTARLVRGQILSLREQEYMVAAEAMGYSTVRKIFKHLVPNVMPQLIVAMTLSLGSMILYEASLSYLGLGVPAPYASWGSMVNAAENSEILENYFNIWGPPGICIIIAVLGFNFVGDGLRDALDPKMRR